MKNLTQRSYCNFKKTIAITFAEGGIVHRIGHLRYCLNKLQYINNDIDAVDLEQFIRSMLMTHTRNWLFVTLPKDEKRNWKCLKILKNKYFWK